MKKFSILHTKYKPILVLAIIIREFVFFSIEEEVPHIQVS